MLALFGYNCFLLFRTMLANGVSFFSSFANDYSLHLKSYFHLQSFYFRGLSLPWVFDLYLAHTYLVKAC